MLPEVTDNMNQVSSDLQQYGLALVSDQLSNKQLTLARDATYRAAQDDITLARGADRFELDYGEGNVRVWNILNRHKVFQQMVQLPVVLTLLKEVIGWPALLSNISANIAEPGSDGGAWHQDQLYIPKPWPPRPQGMNFAWALDEFTSDNGATEVIPGSHLANDLDPSSFDDVAEPLIAPAGTLIVFESRLMHRTGCNRSNDSRAGLFGFYTRPIYRTQENWFLSLDKEVTESASEELLVLLGYKTRGFGLVYGKSPL